MPKIKSDLANLVVDYMIELSRGECTITEEQILNESDPKIQRVLLGFLHLHEDLEFKSHQLKSFSSHVKSRSSEILNIILAIAQHDYSGKVKLTDKNDVFDGVATGLNMLGEELEDTITEKEKVLAEIKEHNKELLKTRRAFINLMEDLLEKELKLKGTNRLLYNKTDDLEKANLELQEFAYVAAHDLKAPLTNLSALADMIDSEVFVDEVSNDIFSKLKKSIGQLHKTVFTLNDIIAFKTTLKDKKERLNFEEMFSEIKDSIADQLEAAGATIMEDFSQCPEIDYPHLHLKSVMQNLLTNAVKYRDPNKILKVEVKTTVRKGRVCFTIKDNGLGFDARKYVTKMMGLFTRLHTHVEGKGVGMYIVKSIVNSHGGKIEARSKPGKGALFTIYLNDGKNE